MQLLFTSKDEFITSDLIWLQQEKKNGKEKKSMSLPVWSWNETEEKTVLLSVQHLEGQAQLPQSV